MTEYTPISRFRKFIRRVEDLARSFGDELQKRGFKTGGTVGQVPRKTNSGDFLWSWANLGWTDVVGKPTSFPPSAHTHPISQITNLQTTLNSKADKWSVPVTKTADYTATVNDDVILVDTTAGNRIITLPPTANVVGLTLVIKKVSVDANTVTIDASNAETIDGNGSEILTVPWQMVRLKSNQTAWFIVGEFTP